MSESKWKKDHKAPTEQQVLRSEIETAIAGITDDTWQKAELLDPEKVMAKCKTLKDMEHLANLMELGLDEFKECAKEFLRTA